MRRAGPDGRRSGGAVRPATVSRQRLLRAALGALLSVEDGVEATDARHGPRAPKPLKPNVVLVDVPTGAAGLELLRTIRQGSPHARLLLLVAEDEGPLTSELRAPASGLGEDGLTTREQEILRLLAAGGTNRDIAQSLSISAKTVKTHLGNIFRKLHVTRRVQAAVYAARREPS